MKNAILYLWQLLTRKKVDERGSLLLLKVGGGSAVSGPTGGLDMPLPFIKLNT